MTPKYVSATVLSDAEDYCNGRVSITKYICEYCWTLMRPSLEILESDQASVIWHLKRGYGNIAATTVRWWRHQMKKKSVLLALCAGNSPVTGEFPAQRPVTRSFDVSLDLRLNKRLSKQSWSWWSETPTRSLWRQCNEMRSGQLFWWRHIEYGCVLTIAIIGIYHHFLLGQMHVAWAKSPKDCYHCPHWCIHFDMYDMWFQTQFSSQGIHVYVRQKHANWHIQMIWLNTYFLDTVTYCFTFTIGYNKNVFI